MIVEWRYLIDISSQHFVAKNENELGMLDLNGLKI